MTICSTYRDKTRIETCRYPDYRSPPWQSDKYEYTALYWRILAARLFFVVIFENVVVLVMIAIKWGIPDMSSNLRNKIRREAYLTNEIIIKHEQLRAQNARKFFVLYLWGYYV